MTIEEFDFLRKLMCDENCTACVFDSTNNGTDKPCEVFIFDHMQEAAEMAADWQREHPEEVMRAKLAEDRDFWRTEAEKWKQKYQELKTKLECQEKEEGETNT